MRFYLFYSYLCAGLTLLAALVACQASEEIYQMLAKDHASKNLIISPFSIDTILSLVYMGAAGATATELQSYLKLPSKDKQLVASKYKAVLDDLLQARADGPTLKLANRIYVNDRFRLREEYNQVARDAFHADAQMFSLDGGVDPTESINKWVLDQTNGEIVDLLSPNSLTSDVMAVLVNAIYFKGEWQSKFDANDTQEANFWVTAEETVPVQMMSQTGDFKVGYFNDLQAGVIELPYLNSNLSMFLFLPRTRDGLSAMEGKISGFSRRLHHMEAVVRLPKFKIEFGEDLKETLQKLGIRELFTDHSDLSDLFADMANGKISKFAHKAVLEVNEEGAEATAATYGMITNRSGFTMSFTFDRPFAFVIRDQRTIYFQGHVVSPMTIKLKIFGYIKEHGTWGNSFSLIMLASKATFSLFLLLSSVLIMAKSINNSSSSAGDGKFSLELFGHLAKSEAGGNLVFSPSSIRTGLALAYLGSGGTTAEELKQGLALEGADKNEVAQRFAQLLAKGQRKADQDEDVVQFNYANRIYVAERFRLAQSYQELAAKDFNAAAENVNFAQGTKAALKINSWVEEQTHNQIKDLISADTLDADTVAILINAIYFKADWVNSFAEYRTDLQDFASPTGVKVKVNTMYQTDFFRYGELSALKAKALEMPYKGTDIVFLIILPLEEQGLPALEQRLSGLNLNEISSQLSRQMVELQLPKFKFEFDVSLKPVLKQMGIETPFGTQANFSSLLQTPDPLTISEVRHKALIEVNENGTTASAATAVKFSLESAFAGEVQQFTADHPFFFAIKDAQSTYFLGHVNQPSV
ncbi:uncharacterized protein LOC111076265 [Drosophila obscura]|uniref:uncharacterized protein LOC111076265 n=1 Tax=Drosophila obscura TaxID=7282 RepID=UPI001BB174C5|nr:uncharacterized protein LOC111076265 [Drosophila obscura]